MIVFIENVFRSERHFTRGFRLGAVRSGHAPEVVWLRDASGELRDPKAISADLERCSPKMIFWIMDSVLPVAQCLETPVLKNVPKASLWFDDFKRTFAIHQYADVHQRLCAESHLKTFVWDGYWRQEFKRQFDVSSYPIHLAADEIDYFPDQPSHFKNLNSALIFIGNIPSLNHVLSEARALPMVCQQLVERAAVVLESSHYGRTGYSVLQELIENLNPKQKLVVDRFCEDVAHQVLLNHLVWLLAKREVRLRILRLASRQKQLVILSGHSDKTFAVGDELARDFGDLRDRIQFVDTTHVPLHQLGALYRTGGLHLQATDPQSIEGGIPFRVFETAASGEALLSDEKPELKQCFTESKEMFFYQNDHDFSEKLHSIIRSWGDLKSIGEQAHQRFMVEHTWKHRFAQIQRAFQPCVPSK